MNVTSSWTWQSNWHALNCHCIKILTKPGLNVRDFLLLIDSQSQSEQTHCQFIKIATNMASSWTAALTQNTGSLALLGFYHYYSLNWLVGRLTSPFSTKIGYIWDKVLGGVKFSQVKDGQWYNNLPTSLPFCSAMTQNGKAYNSVETNQPSQNLFISSVWYLA